MLRADESLSFNPRTRRDACVGIEIDTAPFPTYQAGIAFTKGKLYVSGAIGITTINLHNGMKQAVGGSLWDGAYCDILVNGNIIVFGYESNQRGDSGLMMFGVARDDSDAPSMTTHRRRDS